MAALSLKKSSHCDAVLVQFVYEHLQRYHSPRQDGGRIVLGELQRQTSPCAQATCTFPAKFQAALMWSQGARVHANLGSKPKYFTVWCAAAYGDDGQLLNQAEWEQC